MTLSLLLHVDIPTAFRPAFERDGFVLHPALRENSQSPILPSDDGFDATAIQAVLTIGSIGLTAADIAALPSLRIICCLGVGYEKVDVDAARARGIVVTHGSGTNDTSVADHAMALLLAAARNIRGFDARVRGGEWQSARGATRPQLTGKRVGILGLGHIGGKIAARCAGFDTEIAYHSRRPKPDSALRYCASLLELAAWADYLVVATPGGADTRHLINRQILEALGPNGFLINIARGTVVDTEALIASLQSGAIAGAALDVLEGEPEVPDALLRLDNVTLTPHVAARSPEAIAAMFAAVLENLTRYFDGRPALSPVPGMDNS